MRRIMTLVLAFIGIVVGAGFASGQEMMQYYVAFGHEGIYGGIIAAVLMSLVTMAVFQFASYLLANEHGEVLNFVGTKWIARFLDLSLLVGMFSIGFVMFAGAGTNLNQQWGLETWIGALLMYALVVVVGMLDVDRVTKVIGAVTPFILVLLGIVYVVSFTQHSPSLEFLDDAATQVVTTLPSWWYAALNYSGLVLMTSLSMAVVISGTAVDLRTTGKAGIWGGIVFSMLLVLSVIALYLNVDKIHAAPMPLLSLVNHIHPVLGAIMAVVIYFMIFNTAISLFYAFARRLTASRPEKFRVVYIGVTTIGFALSFAGFKSLVGYVYPIIGVIGLVLSTILIAGWLRYRKKLGFEAARREVVVELARKKFDSDVVFTEKEQEILDQAIEYSNLDEESFREALVEEVVENSEDVDIADWDDLSATNPDPEELKAREEEKLREVIETISAGVDEEDLIEAQTTSSDNETLKHAE
ncbi:YkvI family membrane protein [Arcanobacterium ihumii]|uniref:YkvI family membrane protein n=1 Tax=Arcanobacterium ihumii TaxID=2138162 RepID=UPI000F53DE77|nr:hypothetical protein [Arcanobacterium ihumii]